MKHKDHYNDQYCKDLADKIGLVMQEFDQKVFLESLIGQLEDKELFACLDCIADAMQRSMKGEYSDHIRAFHDLLGPELAQPDGMFHTGWWLWPISRYVEQNGTADWEMSLSFLKELTKRFTGEYAIRPLLKAHLREVLDELLIWTVDENVHVRRLASEGIRIRLPWSQKLTAVLDEFERYAAILTKLRNDPEKFVQKSVGNNLNDLYKEAPEKADALIAQWREMGQGKAQEWIIRHGRRNQK